MERVLYSEEWSRVKEELEHVCPRISHLCPLKEEDVNRIDMHALQEVCYQKIHTGAWCDVSHVWRDAYGGACVVLGLLYMAEGKGKEESIRMFDMGLLLGGDRFRSMTHDMISMLKDSVGSMVGDDDGGVFVSPSGEIASLERFGPLCNSGDGKGRVQCSCLG